MSSVWDDYRGDKILIRKLEINGNQYVLNTEWYVDYHSTYVDGEDIDVDIEFFFWETNIGTIKEVEDNIYQFTVKKITGHIEVKSDESSYRYLTSIAFVFDHFSDDEINLLTQGEQVVSIVDKDDIFYAEVFDETRCFEFRHIYK